MEIEPDQTVEDNAIPVKRKRSTPTDSHPIEDSRTEHFGTLGNHASHRNDVQIAPKRQRLQSANHDLQQYATASVDSKHTYTSSLSSLPVEVLHHVMQFLDPHSLGRLMCVSRYMHTLLDPLQAPVKPSRVKTKLHLKTPESLWSYSRKAYLPDMPQPMRSLTELDMFRLVYGRRCQSCGVLPKSSSSSLPVTQWNSGPGPEGNRTIWPFRSRLCAKCLRPLLLKEMDLSAPNLLLLKSRLVPASFTPSLHYVMSLTLTQASVPSGLQLTKYYFRPHFEELLQRAPNHHGLNGDDYQQWFRDLSVSQRDDMSDVERLERWELSQTAHTNTTTVPSNFTSRSSASGSSIYSDNRTRSFITASSGPYRSHITPSARSGIAPSMLSRYRQRHELDTPQTMPRDIWRQTQSFQGGHISHALSTNTVAEDTGSTGAHVSLNMMRLRAEKRAEIQRRCMALVPPIPPLVLDRLPAFHSALRVLMPLADAEWEKLHIQLSSQKHALEVWGVNERDTNSPVGTAETSSIWRAHTPAAEFIDEDPRRQAERPVREKLYDFAREYVHRRWADGTGLTQDSAPQFAADVLLYVRQRFYQNQADEDAAFAARGEEYPDERPSGIGVRTLKLEHMRYVFETSIKPFTEFVRKELFLCSACDTQGRYFTFEAIIQHFASKHTDDFSRGKAVVHWKSEWPARPPFEPAPGDIDPAVSVVNAISVSHVPMPAQIPVNSTLIPIEYGNLQPYVETIHHAPSRTYDRSNQPDIVQRQRDNLAPPPTYQESPVSAWVPRRLDPGHMSDRPEDRGYHQGYVPPSPEFDRRYHAQVAIHNQTSNEHTIRRHSVDPITEYSDKWVSDHEPMPMATHRRVRTEFLPRSIESDTRYPGSVQDRHWQDNTIIQASRPSYYQASDRSFTVWSEPSIRGLPTAEIHSASDRYQYVTEDPATAIHSGTAREGLSQRSRNAADEFLQSFDVMEHGNEKLSMDTVNNPQFTQAPPRDEITGWAPRSRRRSNMSQLRTSAQSASDFERDDLRLHDVLMDESDLGNRDRFLSRSDTTTQRSRTVYHSRPFQQGTQYSDEQSYTTSPVSTFSFHEAGSSPTQVRFSDRPSHRQSRQYLDQNGRPIDPSGLELRYAEPSRYELYRSDGYYYRDDERSRMSDMEYRHTSQEQPTAAWHAEGGIREHPSEHYYIRYERVPSGERVHHRDSDRRFQPEGGRSSVDERHHGRH